LRNLDDEGDDGAEEKRIEQREREVLKRACRRWLCGSEFLLLNWDHFS